MEREGVTLLGRERLAALVALATVLLVAGTWIFLSGRSNPASADTGGSSTGSSSVGDHVPPPGGNDPRCDSAPPAAPMTSTVVCLFAPSGPAITVIGSDAPRPSS
jgi:hypothetical protein